MTVEVDRFTTPRLVAERLKPAHLADLVPLHLDPEVSRYLGGVRTAEQTAAYLETNLAHWQAHGFGLWMLHTPDGRFAGRAGLRRLPVDGVEEVEVAYTFHRAFWGQGLASEITHALVELGFRRWAFPSLVGLVYVGNDASRRVLEKAGFALEREVDFKGASCVLYRRPART